jgi:hypothetical protein
VRRDGVDDRIKVIGGQVGVLGLDVAAGGLMVPRHANVARSRVVQIRKGELVLSPDGLPNDDLVDVVELIPIIVLLLQIAM